MADCGLCLTLSPVCGGSVREQLVVREELVPCACSSDTDASPPDRPDIGCRDIAAIASREIGVLQCVAASRAIGCRDIAAVASRAIGCRDIGVGIGCRDSADLGRSRRGGRRAGLVHTLS